MEDKMNRIKPHQVPAFTPFFRSVLTILCLSSALALAQSPGASHTITTIASTVPGNGDVNPYGIVVVPHTVGKLVEGNLLISNFNASSNFQGTGTTIVEITPTGQRSLFAHIDAHHLPGTCTGGVGLTTALVVLRSGWGDRGQSANFRRHCSYRSGGMPAGAEFLRKSCRNYIWHSHQRPVGHDGPGSFQR
jgi:hypothetical protein